MQIFIMTGPHSKVRQITLTTRHLVFGGVSVLLFLFAMNTLISSITNETKDILHTMEKNQLLERRFIANSEDDYEAKLMELQARLEEAQRNLDQLDAVRAQLQQSSGQSSVVNLSYAGNNRQLLGFSGSQGGPSKVTDVVINLGNQGEQYGARLDRTVQESIALNTRVEEMQKLMTRNSEANNAAPTSAPMALMPQASSGLGFRKDPFTGQVSWHEGTDFPAAFGTPILATADGVVSRAGWDEDYGYVVDIEHNNGMRTRYGHAQELLVGLGQRVTVGQAIAKVGSTGRSTGPHLHYEILKNGQSLSLNELRQN